MYIDSLRNKLGGVRKSILENRNLSHTVEIHDHNMNDNLTQIQTH